MNNYISKMLLLLLLTTIMGCESGPSDDIMGFEAPSLDICLENIEKLSTFDIKSIYTNEPDEVNGYLENEKFFSCEKKENGTKGVYFKGIYRSSPI